MTTALIVIHVIFALLVVLFILLHRGAGGGLSDMFGGGASAVQGSAMAEKNLNRLTIASVVGFSITTVILGLVL